MITFIYILAKTISIALSVVIYAMIARALLPFFVDTEKSRIYFFVAVITEPFIIPVRALLDRFGIGSGSPIDFSFMLSYLCLIVIQALLPAI